VPRVFNRKLACALTMAATVAAAGCGSSKSSSSSSHVDFKSGFAASHKAFRQLGTDIAKDIAGAGTKTDAELAKEFRGLARRADGQATQLAALAAPSKYTQRMGNLVAGFHSLKLDLSKIATAATKHDASSAGTATRALLVDAAKIKTADTSLSKDLGLPAAQAASSSTSSSVSTTSTTSG
jgi:hypothetical protein